jgi:chromosome partitioning protein
MPSIITLAHQKGGVGKSTIALNLYSYYERAGLRTVIVDIDPQGSITGFIEFSGAERFNLIRRGDFKTYAELLQKIQSFEVVVIDTPPYLSKELEEIIKITDIIIIPCKASLFDVLAIQQTIEYIKSRTESNKKIISAIILTMVISGASLQKETREHLAIHGMPIFQTEIGNRVTYAKSLLISGSVLHDDTGKASKEIENLANEILSLINNS